MRNLMMVATFASMVMSGAASADDKDIIVTPGGSVASSLGSPENFTGHVVVDLLAPPSVKSPSSSGLVTFSPGARTAWHTHPAGQMLIVTAGKGWIQKEGEPRSVIRAGDTVWIPAGVRHWHGATDKTSMSHIAVTYLLDGKGADWMELVSDSQYAEK